MTGLARDEIINNPADDDVLFINTWKFYSLGWLVINGFLCIILIKLKLKAMLEKLD